MVKREPQKSTSAIILGRREYLTDQKVYPPKQKQKPEMGRFIEA
jgi:hypothetical protein